MLNNNLASSTDVSYILCHIDARVIRALEYLRFDGYIILSKNKSLMRPKDKRFLFKMI